MAGEAARRGKRTFVVVGFLGFCNIVKYSGVEKQGFLRFLCCTHISPVGKYIWQVHGDVSFFRR